MQAQLLNVLASSALLQSQLPEVRRLALAETVRASTDEVALQVLLENLSTSPFIAEQQRNLLAELVISERWDDLRNALQCSGESCDDQAWRGDFASFRAMVISVFSRSRKVATVDPARRRRLGAAIHATLSIDELKALTFQSLETTTAFDGGGRELVANDVLDNR